MKRLNGSVSQPRYISQTYPGTFAFTEQETLFRSALVLGSEQPLARDAKLYRGSSSIHSITFSSLGGFASAGPNLGR